MRQDASQAYTDALDVFDRLIMSLIAADPEATAVLCDTGVTIRSSHKGDLTGPDALAGLFGPFDGEAFSLKTTNVYLAGTATRARVSTYLAGNLQDGRRLAFGGVGVVDLVRDGPEDPWMVAALKFQITWVEGDTALRRDWCFPDHARVWQRGDALPVIVSELDAPWHLYPDSALRSSEARMLVDTYARYSWGIDQADFGLLASCYTPDAAGTFQPLGPLSGRDAIIGVLKDFRRAWPMMQHHGEVLGSIVEGDRAAIIVGRIIPQAGQPDGVYGAYYPMRLQRDGKAWRIGWTEYRPGWFDRNAIDLPALLAATMSGEGDRQE